jgi:hypothetical protein
MVRSPTTAKRRRTKVKLAIFDLDGCVSDDRPRRGHLPARGTADDDWTPYHTGCDLDRVVNAEVVWRHDKADHEIVFITSRPERYRAATEAWILAKLVPSRWRLLMRPDGDMTASPELKPALFRAAGLAWADVEAAYDDRADVLAAYRREGVANVVQLTVEGGTAAILREMAATFDERNAVYGDNYLRVAPIIRELFPEGVPPALVTTDRWHLFELLVVKLTRFAVSGLTHTDSIHDAGVYAAMVESDLRRNA